jgi:hypothetical protein
VLAGLGDLGDFGLHQDIISYGSRLTTYGARHVGKARDLALLRAPIAVL